MDSYNLQKWKQGWILLAEMSNAGSLLEYFTGPQKVMVTAYMAKLLHVVFQQAWQKSFYSHFSVLEPKFLLAWSSCPVVCSHRIDYSVDLSDLISLSFSLLKTDLNFST